jgi:hypothetical protein
LCESMTEVKICILRTGVARTCTMFTIEEYIDITKQFHFVEFQVLEKINRACGWVTSARKSTTTYTVHIYS